MSSKSSVGLIRLFSSFTGVSKAASKPTNIAQSQIQKALNLLKESKFNFETITEDDKAKYIKDFTNILSTGLQNQQNTKNVAQHFDQSLLGLNQILTKTTQSSKISHLDSISVKEMIGKVNTEGKLLGLFDDLINNNKMNLSNFRLIIFNKNLRDLKYIIDKLNFVNSDGKFDEMKILIVVKAYMLKSSELATQVYEENIDKWLQMRDQGRLSNFLEKSLYQIIYKHNQDLDLLINNITYTLSSYILLVESLPKKVVDLNIIQLSAGFELSKNQDLFLNFLQFIVTNSVNNKSNNSIRKLVKLSIESQVHKEQHQQDNELTIQKYRFLSGISELAEDLVADYPSDPQLARLIKSIHETDDLLQNETVLKFI